MGDYYKDTLDKAEDFYSNVEEFGVDYQWDKKAVREEETKKVSLTDGFWITRNQCGHIDLEYWSAITGISKDDIIEQANGKLMWLDPKQYELSEDIYSGWMAKEQYLTGNLMRKYKEAVWMNKKSKGLFRENMILLEKNMPEKVLYEDIHISLGATWIPVQFIIAFVQKLLEMKEPPHIEYNSFLGKWIIQTVSEPNHVLNYYTYGTKRLSAIKIIEKILNSVQVKVYDQVPRYDREGNESVINKTETLAAQAKKRAICGEWQKYCHSNSFIEECLQEAYMSRYGYGMSQYDGSFLQLPDLNPKIELYPYQKNAIAHIIMSPSVLLAHDVGAGKTYEYGCGIHEVIRMGMAKKALVVVSNATLDAVYNAYCELYPEDAVLKVMPKRDFSPSKREETLEVIKSDKYSVVFMTYSSFNMITLTRKRIFKKREAEIRECLLLMENAKGYQAKKRYESELKRLRKKYEKLRETFEDTETACFDELGFDILCVDEAHNYKNLSVDFGDSNIVGFHAKGSKKADNLLEKVEYIQEIGGKVIFATGTPITNSLSDVYVFQRYLQPGELKLCNIYHFSDWISTFCSEETGFEVDVDSKNCRFVTRFSKFHNLIELMNMFSEVCDFYQCDSKDLSLPDFNGYTDVVVKQTEALKEYIENLAKRTEAIRNHEVKRTEDNLLKITVDGRLAALDMRLVKPDMVYGEQECKVSVCAKKVLELYHKYPEMTQIIFLDISTPKEGFHLYGKLKEALVEAHIPEQEVRFIHEADTEKKRALMEKEFNEGKIRILIGSTMKLGTGTNVQERLVAIHHLDVPWKPSDMVQREGRIIRQGNVNPEVFIYRYITECSFDSYTYQILENKQKFISQFLSGTLSAIHREETDCSDIVLSYAEIKALAIGNPLIKTRVEVSNKLEHARIKQRHMRKEMGALIELSEMLPEKIETRKVLIRCTKLDKIYHRKMKENMSMDERTEFGEELLFALAGNIDREQERIFSEFHGFDVILPKHMTMDKPYILLKGKTQNRYSVKMDTDKPLGCCMKIEYALNHLEDVQKRHEDTLREYMIQQSQAKQELEQGNIYDEQVEALVDELRRIDEELNGGIAS